MCSDIIVLKKVSERDDWNAMTFKYTIDFFVLDLRKRNLGKIIQQVLKHQVFEFSITYCVVKTQFNT